MDEHAFDLPEPDDSNAAPDYNPDALLAHGNSSAGPTDEKLFFELVKAKAEVSQAFAQLRRYEDDSLARKRLARWAMYVVSAWLFLVMLILFLCGMTYTPFALSHSVLAVLLGTTTLNVLGLMFIVLYGYFPKRTKGLEVA